MWNAQNASYIRTASTAATGLNPMSDEKLNQQPSFISKLIESAKNTGYYLDTTAPWGN